MTHRERLLAILDGQPPDRIPWIPRLLLWYNARQKTGTMPPEYAGLSLRQLEKALGMGTPARDGQVFRTVLHDVEVTSYPDGRGTITEYRTPRGTLTSRTERTARMEDLDLGALEVEHLIKGPQDYAAAEYLVEHTEYLPTYEEYLAYEEEIGDDGYPLVHAGDCPFHDWLQKWAGYGRAYFDLHDYPERVERLLEVMTQVHKERLWPLIAQSPARLILHGLHFSSLMTPPPLFEKYILPYYQEFSALLHQHHKRLCFHADADTSQLLELIRQAGFDMAETFVTAPMVPCTLRQARETWGSDVIIWGGVPSVILEDPTPDEEFTAYMEELFTTIAPGDAFILGVADNVMPAAKLDRLLQITEMVEERGTYPIRTR